MRHVPAGVISIIVTSICMIHGETNKTRWSCSNEIVISDGAQYEWRYNSEYSSSAYALSTLDNLCWQPTNDTAAAAPAKPVIRKCDANSNKWLPPKVSCAKPLQKKKNTYCPEGLIEIKTVDKDDYICIHISQRKHTFAEFSCYGADKIPFSPQLSHDEMRVLTPYLDLLKIREYWLPVQKPEGNPLHPFVVRLPGEFWGRTFTKSLSADELLADKHCLTAFYNEQQRQWDSRIASCDDSMHSVCIFRKHMVTVSGCPQGFGAISYRPDKCYGIEWVAGLFPFDLHNISLAEYFEKRNMLRLIFKFGKLERGRHFQVDDFDGFEGDDQRYAIEMNDKEHIRIVPLQENSRKAALSWELLRNRKSVQMSLKMDSDELTLTVYNRYYIWRLGSEENVGINCFTNAGYELLQSVKIDVIWQNELKTKTMYQLRMVKGAAGMYWCEAHTIFNFGLVSTEKLVAEKEQRGHRFAVAVNVTCENALCNLQNLKILSRAIKQKLKDHKNFGSDENPDVAEIQIHDVHIMKIRGIWQEVSTTLECVCHVTASLKSSSVDNSSEQSSEQEDSEENEAGVRHDSQVRMRLRQLLHNLIATAYPNGSDVVVRSTEFCFPKPLDGSPNNMWLQADLGQSATTLKLCLLTNGLPITRRCVGDFIEGAHWEPMSVYTQHTCKPIADNNKITQSLYDLEDTKVYRKSPEKAVKDVKQLLEKHLNNLIPADFYYMAKIIQSSVKRLTATSSSLSSSSSSSPATNNTNLMQLSYSDEAAGNMVRIYNYLMEVSESIIKPSIVLNSTNILLDAFENLIDEISIASNRSTTRNITGPLMAMSGSFMPHSTTLAPSMLKSNKIIDDNVKHIDSIEYEDIGAIVKLTTNLVIFVLNPRVANVSGIALFNSNYDDDNEEGDNFDTSDYYEMGLMHGAFKGKYYRFIMSNQSVGDLLYESGIEIATYVPKTLLDRLDEISNASNSSQATNVRPEPRIVIKIYANDKLFQEDENDDDHTVWGKIISVSIPGHDKDLPEMLPLMLRVKMDDDDMANYADGSQEDDNTTSLHSCSYWNYKSWVNDGIAFMTRSAVDPSVILCGCTHLTPFAYIIGGDNFKVDYDDDVHNDSSIETVNIHRKALDIITLLGCSLSLFGIIGIFITAFTFQSWRQKASSKVLLQLSAAIALQMILFCFVNTEQTTEHLLQNQIISSCILLGASLHYSVLVQFSWMLIIAYLQFKRYVQVFGNSRPKRFFIKSTAVGWMVPLIPVVLLVIFDYDSYIPTQSPNQTEICYPKGLGLYLGIVMPVSLVILANFIIFVVVLYNIIRGPEGSIRHTEKKLALSQIRLTVLLFFLLGFTWIFGLLTTARAGLVFSYLFSITATLQGFVIFVYFIVLDPVTRRLWSVYCRRKFAMKSTYDNSTTSVKETTQTQ